MTVTLVSTLVTAVSLAGTSIYAVAVDQLAAITRDSTADQPSKARPQLARLFAWFTGHLHEAIQRLIQQADQLETRCREAEVRLRVAELEASYGRDLLDTMREAVVATDPYGDLLFVNDAAARLFDLDPARSLHKPVDKTINDPQIARLFREAAASRNETVRRLLDHSMSIGDRAAEFEITLGAVASPSVSESRGVVGVFRDVTREREISKAKTDFVAKASHELRTPLSSIRARIEMLADGDVQDEATRAEFYQVIQSETNRLSRLIDQMLNISRIEAGITQARWEDIDVAALAQEAADLVGPQARERNIALTVRKGTLSYRAQADREMMLQVLINLASNAVKYTPEGGSVTITTDLSDDNQAVTVFVDDTGLGIPDEALPKMFQKFYRVEQNKEFAKGTGLGLNLVKQIIEVVHGGEVGVSSSVGKGSRFWVTIPCVRRS